MMTFHEGELMKWATAYIENGKIKKWGYDSYDKEDLDSILNVKQYTQESLTELEGDEYASSYWKRTGKVFTAEELNKISLDK